jgi:predicted metalloenzyme YecM
LGGFDQIAANGVNVDLSQPNPESRRIGTPTATVAETRL